MTRRVLLFIGFMLLLLAESVYYAKQGIADCLRFLARQAFIRQEYRTAWQQYEAALSWGGDKDTLETNLAELLLFGVAQFDARVIQVDLPMSRAESAQAAHELVAHLISRIPYRAYYWSLASQSYLNEGRRLRREAPISIAALSTDPLENFRSEDWRGIAALEVATRLEPNSPVYNSALVDVFLDLGSPESAAAFVQGAVANYPVLRGHDYLARRRLAPEILEAAVRGFEEAAGSESMIPAAVIETEAGMFLVRHGEDLRAIKFLTKAIEMDPTLYDPHYQLGYALFRLKDFKGAIEQMRAASAILPEMASPLLYLGLAHLALEDVDSAILDFTRARTKRPAELKYFLKLGEALERAGRIDEAARQYAAAATLHPKNAEALSHLLRFYLRQNDRKGALEVCSRVRAVGDADDATRARCARLEQGAF